MRHSISLAAVLYGVWLLLSGYFEPLLLFFGVISCAIVLLVVHRMDVVDHEGHPIHLGWRAVAYWGWLLVEIVKANLDVSKRILAPGLPIHPVLVPVKATQGSELGLVIFANSITLTPGTVSITVDDDSILVHAIAEEHAADLHAGEMDRRVTRTEAGTPRLEASERAS